MTPSIVVLTDAEASSNHALAYAAALAMPQHAHLVLVHVRFDELLSHQEYVSHYCSRSSEEKTKQALNALAQSQPVPADVEIYDDFLADAVAETARQHQPQLVVLGRPEPTVLPPDVVTRAVEDLLRQMPPVPLLVVPAAGRDTVAPRQLVLAVDSNEFSLHENLKILDRLVDTHQAKLAVLHVAPAVGAATDAGPRAVLAVRRSGLASLAEEEQAHLVCNPDPATGVLQGANELDADLLIVIARPRSWVGSLFHRSVTAQVVGKSNIPVLVLPALP